MELQYVISLLYLDVLLSNAANTHHPPRLYNNIRGQKWQKVTDILFAEKLAARPTLVHQVNVLVATNAQQP